ncbi:MAG: diguanylate cyclase [Microthrixaceae bacterium]
MTPAAIRSATDYLRASGSALRNSARRQDIACRTGGDEFVVVLPAAHIEAATAIAHRIRMNIPSALASVTAEHPVAVTVSVGVATGDDAAGLDSVPAPSGGPRTLRRQGVRT